MRHFQREPSLLQSFRELSHRTRIRWIATAIVAVVSLSWTLSTVNDAESARHAWGRRRSIPVASGDLAPGRIISAADLEFVDRPTAVLPDDIAQSPVGRTVRRAIARNEVIIEGRLAGGTATGPTALLDERTVAFAISSDGATPPVVIGDLVALFAPSETAATATRGAGPALRVTENAVVVAVTERAVTVAVDQNDAPALARALLSSTVVLALSG